MTFPQSLRNECTVDGHRIHLTPLQTRFLETLLMRGPGKFISFDELIDILWPLADLQPISAQRLLQSYISRMRKVGIPLDTRFGRGVRIAPRDVRECYCLGGQYKTPVDTLT